MGHVADELTRIERAIDLLAPHLGGRAAARHKMLVERADQILSIHAVLSSDASARRGGETRRRDDRREEGEEFPGLGVLRKALADYHTEVLDLRVGQPSTVRIRALRHDVFVKVNGVEFDAWTMVNAQPTIAAISYAKARHKYQASFTLGGLTQPVTDESPTVAFLVLRDEARVWCLPYAYARQIYEKLKNRERVKRFALAASNGSIRATLPKKRIDLDLDLALHIDREGVDAHEGHQ